MSHILHIALSFLLLLASTGVSVSKHYCMGLLKEMSMSQKEPFSCCLTEDESGCCDFEDELLVLGEVYDLNQKPFTVSLDWQLATSSLIAYCRSPYALSTSVHFFPFSHAPPLQDTPRHVFLCTFLI